MRTSPGASKNPFKLQKYAYGPQVTHFGRATNPNRKDTAAPTQAPFKSEAETGLAVNAQRITARPFPAAYLTQGPTRGVLGLSKTFTRQTNRPRGLTSGVSRQRGGDQ